MSKFIEITCDILDVSSQALKVDFNGDRKDSSKVWVPFSQLDPEEHEYADYRGETFPKLNESVFVTEWFATKAGMI